MMVSASWWTGSGHAASPEAPRMSMSGSRRLAPSTGLRRWYGHKPARFAEFRRRYNDELREPGRAEALTHLTESARQGIITPAHRLQGRQAQPGGRAGRKTAACDERRTVR